MHLYFTGVIIAFFTFLIIGFFHPIVIKTEYHFGTRYWWVFLVVGLLCIGFAFLVANPIYSSLLGVTGASSIWGIGELFHQKVRVEKGWFPMNPKRKHEYFNRKKPFHSFTCKSQADAGSTTTHETE